LITHPSLSSRDPQTLLVGTWSLGHLDSSRLIAYRLYTNA
jgi:hypothetical protein